MFRKIASGLLMGASMFVAAQSKAQSQAETDDKIISEYLTKNKIKASRTQSGLYYVISKEGTGAKLKAGQRVAMKYLGTFLDGKRFDGNMDENFELKGSPFRFVLGAGQVIRGWDEGIQFMSVGSQGTLYLPSPLAYGPGSVGPIPPNSILVFKVEVVSAE